VTYSDELCEERTKFWVSRLRGGMTHEDTAARLVQMERDLDALRQVATVYQLALDEVRALGYAEIHDALEALPAAPEPDVLELEMKALRALEKMAEMGEQ